MADHLASLPQKRGERLYRQRVSQLRALLRPISIGKGVFDAVLIVSPCSGHGFKHSPAIGEAVAQWILGGASDLDLEPFALARAVRRVG